MLVELLCLLTLCPVLGEQEVHAGAQLVGAHGPRLVHARHLNDTTHSHHATRVNH